MQCWLPLVILQVFQHEHIGDEIILFVDIAIEIHIHLFVPSPVRFAAFIFRMVDFRPIGMD
ncbi:MAG: hypothetical protein JXA97_13025 [Anaerolineales bacterium]|nr:hypothetical protein [Anaerolineales bacterium]